MKTDIQRVLDYYSIFKYAPKLQQVWNFLPARRQLRQLKMGKGIIVKRGCVILSRNVSWIQESIHREKIASEKIKKANSILQLLGKLPWVKFIGISGSIAAYNAKDEDDIDLFIITAAKRLWTARFFLTILSSLLGKRRGRTDQVFKDKLCFNLFFDEQNLLVPKNKQTEYVAHEVLQVVSIVNKNGTYEKFLYANRWVKELFPNVKLKSYVGAKLVSPMYSGDFKIAPTVMEQFLKWLQLLIISRHQTSELITKTQLWFFPDDFALKIPKRMIYSS